MNNFQRFQERNKKRAQAQIRGNCKFVFQGYNSTTIQCGDESIQAAVVNEQEKDSAYIYTQEQNSLKIGSIWEAKSLHFLITEEIIIIKDVTWHKYLAELCNTQIDGMWGRFIGPEETYINVALKQNVSIVSRQKPVLIMPSGSLSRGDKIIIKGRPWLVQESDEISTEGVGYYSLTSTTVSKDEGQKIIRAQDQYSIDQETTHCGDNITVSTEDGYFICDNPNIEIVQRAQNKIIFIMPFGTNSVSVSVKENGSIVQKTYKAE